MKLYMNKQTSNKKAYIMKGEPGTQRVSKDYALWQPVNRFGNKLKPAGEEFLLDMYGFYQVALEDIEDSAPPIDYKASYEKQRAINKILLLTNALFLVAG